MVNYLRQKPFYLILLPVFFVLHGYLENFGFISAVDTAKLGFSYIFLTIGVFIFSYIFLRNWTKAAFITTVWMCFFFFFGAIHEFLKEHSPVERLSRYSFLVPVSFLLLLIIFIILKKIKKPLLRTTLFLNVLFFIYILVDLGGIVIKATTKTEQRLSVYNFSGKRYAPSCDTCQKPDIYLLLMDEYGGSASLQEQYGFENDLDSFLLQKGFSVQTNSHSNYNFTGFSMASLLNMSYLTGIRDVKAVVHEEYANCNLLIRDNEVINVLDAQGYDIVNYSIFDLAGHPATVEQNFLPLKTKLITDRTLFGHMNKDIGWFFTRYFPFNLFRENSILKHTKNNDLFLKNVKESASAKHAKPRFIYAHFYMPHAPYFYTRDGKRKDNRIVFLEYLKKNVYSYLENLRYTNTQIKSMVNEIQQNDPSAVIILLSDHGFRGTVRGPRKFNINFFQNLNAVYFPDKQYGTLYDSITNVNQFRVILNKMFDLKYPILQDSIIFLVDKKSVEF